jgi:hypothetical protein
MRRTDFFKPVTVCAFLFVSTIDSLPDRRDTEIEIGAVFPIFKVD